jgi:formate hydrogenlyase subunit 3/multisubunit Na+/H+ antiporter MnhD subunit
MSALAALLLPLLLAAGLAGPARLRACVLRIAPWAPLALVAPLFATDDIHLEWPLLGVSLAADAVSRPIVLLTLFAWTLAGWYAASRITERRRWFWSGWLGALAGMQMLLFAGDLASFYVGYALLSLTAYLLVTHAADPEAWRAGRVYLVMALAGEAALLVGILQLAGALGNAPFATLLAEPAVLADSPARWLLFAGFAVKLGIMPLHLWLPLAHPVAPVPASAILSGVIVKAGLMGWLRFVPALTEDPTTIGHGLLALGLVTAFGGVALGLTQQRLKTVLAYSTISQMGLVLAGFALAFLVPGGRDALLATLGLLALHHGLNKASLFLACGCAPGATRLRLLLFALPALSLAAAPFTTGYLAKDALKQGFGVSALPPSIALVVALTSTATALLMWKAFRLARQQAERAIPMHPAWPLLVAAAAVLPWAYALSQGLVALPGPAKLVDALWPLLLAAVLWYAHRRLLGGRSLRLPEGDLVVIVERALAGRPRLPQLEIDLSRATLRVRALGAWLLRQESAQRRMPVMGLALLLVGTALFAVSWWAGVA